VSRFTLSWAGELASLGRLRHIVRLGRLLAPIFRHVLPVADHPPHIQPAGLLQGDARVLRSMIVAGSGTHYMR
jgi:hypothetical protein